jgi:putative methionine-R-sulfoxide reductase with GAF domain
VSGDTRRGVVDAVDRILNRGGDADDVLRAVVAILVERGGYAWAGISFVEGDALIPGPAAGEPDEARRSAVPVIYRGERVGELAVDGPTDEELLERLAVLISAHVLLGWDTGGERWTP